MDVTVVEAAFVAVAANKTDAVGDVVTEVHVETDPVDDTVAVAG